MGLRAWIAVLLVVAILLPLIDLVWAVADGISDRRFYAQTGAGGYPDLQLEFTPEARARMRRRLVRRPLRDALLIGGGVIAASAAGLVALAL